MSQLTCYIFMRCFCLLARRMIILVCTLYSSDLCENFAWLVISEFVWEYLDVITLVFHFPVEKMMARLLWWIISWQQTQIPVRVWYCEDDFSFLLFEQGNWWQSYFVIRLKSVAVVLWTYIHLDEYFLMTIRCCGWRLLWFHLGSMVPDFSHRLLSRDWGFIADYFVFLECVDCDLL